MKGRLSGQDIHDEFLSDGTEERKEKYSSGNATWKPNQSLPDMNFLKKKKNNNSSSSTVSGKGGGKWAEISKLIPDRCTGLGNVFKEPESFPVWKKSPKAQDTPLQLRYTKKIEVQRFDLQQRVSQFYHHLLMWWQITEVQTLIRKKKS